MAGSDSARFWDRIAERYARSPVADEAAYQRKLEETRSFLEPGMRILEFGCGTGTTALHHALHVRHIQAIDISGNMLAIACRKARDAGIDNITFTRCTLAELEADDESFDAVLGLNVIHLLPDRQAAFSEVARILKPGGIFVSSTVCLGGSPLRFIRLVAPLGRMLGLMPELFVLTEAALAAEISRAGFRITSQWHHGRGDIAVFIIARKP